MNQTLNGLGLGKRPEKTFVGRIERGFDFLGYHLRPEGLRVAQATQKKFIARATQLYEQGPGGGEASRRPAWAVRSAMGQVGSGGAQRGPTLLSDPAPGATTVRSVGRSGGLINGLLDWADVYPRHRVRYEGAGAVRERCFCVSRAGPGEDCVGDSAAVYFEIVYSTSGCPNLGGPHALWLYLVPI